MRAWVEMIIEKALAPSIVRTLGSFTAISTALIGANENHHSKQLERSKCVSDAV